MIFWSTGNKYFQDLNGPKRYNTVKPDSRLTCNNILPLVGVLPAGCARHDVTALRLNQSGRKRGVGLKKLTEFRPDSKNTR